MISGIHLSQVLYRKVVVKVEGPNAAEGALARAIEAIVPTRLYTVPELRLLARSRSIPTSGTLAPCYATAGGT